MPVAFPGKPAPLPNPKPRAKRIARGLVGRASATLAALPLRGVGLGGGLARDLRVGFRLELARRLLRRVGWPSNQSRAHLAARASVWSKSRAHGIQTFRQKNQAPRPPAIAPTPAPYASPVDPKNQNPAAPSTMAPSPAPHTAHSSELRTSALRLDTTSLASEGDFFFSGCLGSNSVMRDPLAQPTRQKWPSHLGNGQNGNRLPKAVASVDGSSKASVYRALGGAAGLAGQIFAGEGRVLTANGCYGMGVRFTTLADGTQGTY